MKYYKKDSIAIKYDDKTKESKVNGVIDDISGELALEVIQLGEEITKEEYENI